MITESKLEALKFNKIIWRHAKRGTEYWLPLRKPTGNQITEMDCLSVRFNEFEDEPGPMVYLVLRSASVQLPHIKLTSQLIQLYELLAGRSFEVGDG